MIIGETLLSFSLQTAYLMNASKPLTIEAFCKSPSLSGPSPSGLKLSPDGSCLTFLRGRPNDKDYNDLWRLPLTNEDGSPNSNPQPTLFVDADRLGLSGSDGTELSAEEKARRERMRVAQAKGILQYYWSSNSEYILLPAGNTLWMYRVSTGELELLPVSDVETKGAVIDAQLSPDSSYVSYTREDQNLYVFHLPTQKEIAITTDGSSTIRNGVAEFVAQEEMSRMTGYWWSPQTRFLAFTRIDESYVENVQRNEVYADGVKMTYQRYPYAGKQNVRLQLGVVDLTKAVDGVADASSKVWLPLDQEEDTTDFYLPRVKWVACGDDEDEMLSYQYQSRDQKLLRLKLAEVHRGFTSENFDSLKRLRVQDGDSDTATDLGALLPENCIRTLLTESEPNAYVNLVGDGDLYFCYRDEKLRSEKIFFWLSERDTGFKSIFVGTYAINGEEKETALIRLTDKIGDSTSPFFGQHYVVDSLEFIDEKRKHLYFTGRRTSPVEKHLYRLDFGQIVDNLIRGDRVECSDSCITQVTKKTGFHNVSFSSNGDLPLYIDSFSSNEQPPQYSLWRAATDASHFGCPEQNAVFITWVEENNFRLSEHPLLPYYDSLNKTPEFGTFLADDGKTDIWYRLFVPSDEIKQKQIKETGSNKLPCLVYVYGGPHVQVCSTASSWRDQSFLLQYFIQQGFIVLSVDNRGSTARGLEFESSIYLDAGQREISDQVMGVEKVLLSRDDVDPNRICMYGHSYGGYMSLMCLFRAYRDVQTNKCGYYRFGEEPADSRKPLFRCSIAGAPVSRWDLYDTHYTERYMGIPNNEFGVQSEFLNHPEQPFLNIHGYAHSRVHDYVKYYNDTTSRLMMYHGMADDNVLFQHSTEIYKLLIDSGKLFNMIDYPGAKHGMSGETTKIHLYRSIWEFVKIQMS